MGSAAGDAAQEKHQRVDDNSHPSTSTSASTVSAMTVTPPSTRTHSLPHLDTAGHPSPLVTPSFSSPCLHTTRASEPLPTTTLATASTEASMPRPAVASPDPTMASPIDENRELARASVMTEDDGPRSHPQPLRPAMDRTRDAAITRSGTSLRGHASARNRSGPHGSSSSSVVDRRLLEKYERVNSEIERVIRATNAEGDGENGELLKRVRSELRKVRRSSSTMIQSQKELLEKMERQERSGLRRMFSMNREQKMEKLRSKLCDKLNQSVLVDEELQRLERQSVSLTRMSFGSMCSPMEIDELSVLEREREDCLNNLLNAAGLTDAQELQARLALFSSERKACECSLKQVEQVETHYRKALHLLRIALSTIVAPTYTGGLREFVLGPYPLAVEGSQLIEAANRVIQPESRRRYPACAPELSNVRPPKFPQQMVDFAKRGARCNFDPNNSAAIEAIRKLRTAENVVILMQRIVIQKLELVEKWRREVERDQERAESGYRKFDAQLQDRVAALARSVSAA